MYPKDRHLVNDISRTVQVLRRWAALAVALGLLLPTLASPAAVHAETLGELRSIDRDVPYVLDARQAALGGAGVAVGSGPFAGFANAALYAPERELRAAYAIFGGVGGYHEGGRAKGMAMAGRLGRWHLGMAFVGEDFGDMVEYIPATPLPVTIHDGPSRTVLDLGLATEVTRGFGLDPERWGLHLGASGRGSSWTAAEGGSHIEADATLGLSLRRRPHPLGSGSLAWSVGASLVNLVDLISRAPAARWSDATAGFAAAWMPESRVKHVGRTEDFLSGGVRAHRIWPLLSVRGEVATHLDGRRILASRLGAEVGALWWLRLRAGWSHDPRALTDGLAWGLGTQLGRDAHATLDLAFVSAGADDLGAEGTWVLSMSMDSHAMASMR